ncbi:EpsG family protein [Sphingobacterium spiritivorum]|uniref:EpsG family protein n=1 Tax=Sphingobacterium spiritivorum TaxID=258 RepID=UPI003DA53CAA
MLDIILTILLLFLSILFKKSRTITILFFLFMWTLWGANTWNGDSEAYKWQFDNAIWNINTGEYERGYVLLTFVLKYIGLTYQQFLGLISFIVLTSILISVMKYSKYPALFSLMYFLVFIMEFVYLRNYIVHALLLFGVILVLEKVKYYKLWFILIVLLATSIHSTAIIGLIFCFAFFNNENKLINIKKVLIYVGVFVFFMAFLFDVLLSVLGSFYLNKLSYYATGGGFSNVFFAHLILVLIIYYFFDAILKKSQTIPIKVRRWYIIIVNINILSLFYLGLYFQVPYFARIVRFLFTLDLIFMTSALYYIGNLKLRLRSFTYTWCVFLFIIIMFLKSTLSLTLYPLYKKNKIWGEEVYVPNFDYDANE